MFVVAGLAGLIVLLILGTWLFQAGCALADVPERGYLRSLPVHAVAVVVCAPLAAVFVWYAGHFDSDPATTFGAARIAALVVSLLLSWLLSAGIFALLLSASLRKGLLIAGAELLMTALLAALVAAVVLVILAFAQIITRPPPVKAALSPCWTQRHDS
jgi:hypothetical protein